MQFNTKQTLLIYWRHLRRYRLAVFLTLSCVVGAAAVSIVVPLYFKRFFDLLAVGNALGKPLVVKGLIGTLVVIFILEIIQWIFWRISTFNAAYFQSHVIADLANSCFVYLHRHSFGYFNNNFVGSLVKRVNRFTRSFESITDRVLWNILSLIVNISLIAVILTYKNIKLGLIVISWVAVFLIINWFLTKFKLKYDVARSEADTEISRDLADTITNHANVKLFCGLSRETKNFEQVNEKARKLRRFTWNLDIIFEAVQGFLMILLEIGVFYFATILWQRGIFTVGDFVLLQSYVLLVFMKIWDFGRVVRHIYEDLADAEEMTEIFLTPHEIVDVVGAKKLAIKAGQIDLVNVSFCYQPDRCVIKGMNVSIKSKEKIALVGPSGAGKTTMVKLLLRMHDISGGRILIDGQDINQVTQESLWKNISMVPQDPILFHRSLGENISYGKPQATNEEVILAAKLAHCHEFITGFEYGYDTKVGERGIKLSGGERQRVAIARAILRNAPVLVLDEATSSLDSESERLIQEALDVLMKDKTVIVIAHRLSTIMKVDRIMVIDEGGIIEQGKHAELLKLSGGIYKKLWKIQAGGFIT